MEIAMTAIARALTRAFITINDIEVLKQLALFAAAGLLVSVLMLTYGVDLSPGFF
jgi:ribose/xylose/arabinose/galactoside ABC-type transport system permease subunit